MLNTAVDDGLLRSNPCRGQGRRPGELSGSVQSRRPTRRCASPRTSPTATVRWCCWLRIARCASGSLRACAEPRIDLLHRTITIEEQAVELAEGSTIFGPPKSAAGRRVVAFPTELVPMLEQHLEGYVNAPPDSLVFTSRRAFPCDGRNSRTHRADACSWSEVTGLHFHDLRGSGATWAATAGATVRELMSRLGPRHSRRWPCATSTPRSSGTGRLRTPSACSVIRECRLPTVARDSDPLGVLTDEQIHAVDHYLSAPLVEVVELAMSGVVSLTCRRRNVLCLLCRLISCSSAAPSCRC